MRCMVAVIAHAVSKATRKEVELLIKEEEVRVVSTDLLYEKSTWNLIIYHYSA
jgi:hypothetical protein